MIGIVERPRRDQAAIRLARKRAFVAIEKIGEQMRLGDAAAGGDGVDVHEGGRRALRPRDDARGIVNRAVIGMAEPPPVFVADAELDGRAGLADELEFVEAEMFEEDAEHRRGPLADADDRNLGAFHDGDFHRHVSAFCAVLQHQRRDPARRAAADDDEVGR